MTKDDSTAEAVAERPSGPAGRRESLLSVGLGAFSFAVPHYALLFLTNMQTFFQRETTLWMTYVLLMSSAIYVGFAHVRLWRQAAAMMIGTTLAVLLYLLTTVDLRGTQLYGAIPPLFLWVVAIGSALTLTTPVVLIGVLVGGRLRALRFADTGSLVSQRRQP